MARRSGITNLSAPKVVTFWIAVLLAAIAALTGYALWLVVAGFVLLALGNLLEGL